MHSLHCSARHPAARLAKVSKARPLSVPLPSRTMSLFPRFTDEFSPLFRLLDDYDKASRQGPLTRQVKSFTPKFDVREVQNGYELHGELPGLDQKNVTIEWTDGNTLSISGHTERHTETSRDNGQSADAMVEGAETYAETNVETNDQSKQQQPTIEDEDAMASAGVVKKTATGTSVSDNPRYWISERSVGGFRRSFSLPARVDRDAVKASLKNGILNIVVPKKSGEAKRQSVSINSE